MMQSTATKSTGGTTQGQMSISPESDDTPQKRSKNIMEWKTHSVCEFLSEILGGRHQEMIETVQKHQVCGVDLVDMTEQNLIELGIPTMHERKQVLRSIRQWRNEPQSTYGKFKVRMLNPSTKKYQEVILKVSDNETKVKHILKQAFQVFTKAKCDISDFCLAKISSTSKTKSILSNETIFLSLLHEVAGSLDLFEIFSGGDIVTQTSVLNGTIQTISAESPSSILLPNQENTSLEQILQSPPSNDPQLLDTLNEEDGLFDHGAVNLMIPSFIDKVGGNQPSEEVITSKIISRPTSSEGLKLKARIGSGNIANALKEKLAIKRNSNRNHNATQLNSQGSQEKQQPREKWKPVVQQPYCQPQKQQRQGSQSSQERFLGASLNLMPQQRTFDTKPRMAPNKQTASNMNIATAPSEGDMRQRRKQLSVTKTPVGSVQSVPTSALQAVDKSKLKVANRQAINMFQTLNEAPSNPNRMNASHKRHSSKSSFYIAASDMTTERGAKPQLQYPQDLSTRIKPTMRQPCPNPTLAYHDDQSNILQCSLEVQNTIHTMAETNHQISEPNGGVGNLNQILSDFLNEMKSTQYIESQINNKHERGDSQSRQQQLLEQDSLETKALEQEMSKYGLVECQQAYFNEQDQISQMNLLGISEQQYQLSLRQKAMKQIQTKSVHALAALTNQKRSAKNCTSQVKRQNYVNQGAKSSQMLYGTFDNTVCRQNDSVANDYRLERGSSVGEQFYTIDNTNNKENMNGWNRGDCAPIQHQRQQPPITSKGLSMDQQKVSSASHIKIKGLKLRANQEDCTNGLVRTKTMGERLRSNSNNSRLLINNRYGESNDDMQQYEPSQIRDDF